jgi:hypothetical protein
MLINLHLKQLNEFQAPHCIQKDAKADFIKLICQMNLLYSGNYVQVSYFNDNLPNFVVTHYDRNPPFPRITINLNLPSFIAIVTTINGVSYSLYSYSSKRLDLDSKRYTHIFRSIPNSQSLNQSMIYLSLYFFCKRFGICLTIFFMFIS